MFLKSSMVILWVRQANFQLGPGQVYQAPQSSVLRRLDPCSHPTTSV
uniref:Acylamino-acid-releasing enzyme n=1 Tax=Rhizophora mucronata TaxID=61149 RepID=A0A2P2LK29_RHIMU